MRGPVDSTGHRTGDHILFYYALGPNVTFTISLTQPLAHSCCRFPHGGGGGGMWETPVQQAAGCQYGVLRMPQCTYEMALSANLLRVLTMSI